MLKWRIGTTNKRTVVTPTKFNCHFHWIILSSLLMSSSQFIKRNIYICYQRRPANRVRVAVSQRETSYVHETEASNECMKQCNETKAENKINSLITKVSVALQFRENQLQKWQRVSQERRVCNTTSQRNERYSLTLGMLCKCSKLQKLELQAEVK